VVEDSRFISTWLLIDAKGCGCSAESTREGGDGWEGAGENGQRGAASHSICMGYYISWPKLGMSLFRVKTVNKYCT